ncbi:BglG family transcription antiterminator [Breznakia pachnodae]|uniref:Lichenan operon transcriptional antiterminator n=1 Tax=Breznakia pachnodae TaxID=265178 RepID=A0ABU0E0M5_9FIRM|nr:BglG family transcription antiterminator [Breznakia pachnodae]MDQ0360442.1 lichenan operon transcriptional antiterminator [Breznakia pachnodae]
MEKYRNIMMSERQKKLLIDLYNSKGEYLSAKELSSKYNVSARSIQNDISEIRKVISNYDFLSITSISSKGSKLNVEDEKEMEKLLAAVDDVLKTQVLTSKKDRINRIVSILFNSKQGITIDHLADRLFVSKSTLTGDLKLAKEMLDRYDVKIANKRNKGILIVASEAQIRKCIIKENIDMSQTYTEYLGIGQMSEYTPKLGDILVNTLTEYKYRISNIALQNLIVHLDIIVRRINDGFYLNEKISEISELDEEIEIAKTIFKKCTKIFNIPIVDNEVIKLAVYLKGKSDYNEESYITTEIDDFVLDSMIVIKQKFGFDFIDNFQLRISLALHMIPLLTRLKYDIQLKNSLLPHIRNTYPLAFDIASLVSFELQKKFNYKITQDETSYFAIYFNNALESYKKTDQKNTLLVISSLKRSETLLLRERIKYLMGNAFSDLNVVNVYDLDQVNFDDYTVVCTTEDNDFFFDSDVLQISQFPGDEDRRNIMMAIDGYTSKEEILELFKRESFYVGKSKGKSNIIKTLCNSIHGEDTEKLIEQVQAREMMGGTYYGNRVAMPHTMYPTTDKTHIAVAILEDDLLWDNSGNIVKIVLLISVEKDNPKAFNLWTYLSEFSNNEAFVSLILANPNYENFISALSVAIK